MTTLRQLQRDIAQKLAAEGYYLQFEGDDNYVLLRDGRAAQGDGYGPPPNIELLASQWLRHEKERSARKGATPAMIELVNARLQDLDYAHLDPDQVDALERGTAQGEAWLDDLQARLGVFTDDISAAMSGEHPGAAFANLPEFPMHAWDLMQLYSLIRRGEHPHWGGDRIANGDDLMWKFAKRAEAPAVLAQIEGNVQRWSDETGSPSASIEHAVNRIRDALPTPEVVPAERVQRYVTGVGMCWMEDGEILERVEDDDDAPGPRP